MTAAMPDERPSCAAVAVDGRSSEPAAGEDARVTSPPPEPVVIHGGDRACVALLLELRRRICDLSAGTVIHLIASDPAASIDLPAWCHLTGHAYLGASRAATPAYALRTTAAPFATGPASPWKRHP
jgi:tRNA 2-thiouridine synthesizing protein A